MKVGPCVCTHLSHKTYIHTNDGVRSKEQTKAIGPSIGLHRSRGLVDLDRNRRSIESIACQRAHSMGPAHATWTQQQWCDGGKQRKKLRRTHHRGCLKRLFFNGKKSHPQDYSILTITRSSATRPPAISHVPTHSAVRDKAHARSRD